MVKMLDKPNTEPFGDVIEFPMVWSSNPLFDENDEYLGEEEDRTHTIESINGHFQKVPVGNCRACGGEVKEYSIKYYQPHYESCERYSFLFCAANHYCEECAKKAASEEHLSGYLPRVVNQYTKIENGSPVEVSVYADGSQEEVR